MQIKTINQDFVEQNLEKIELTQNGYNIKIFPDENYNELILFFSSSTLNISPRAYNSLSIEMIDDLIDTLGELKIKSINKEPHNSTLSKIEFYDNNNHKICLSCSSEGRLIVSGTNKLAVIMKEFNAISIKVVD